MVQGPPRLDEAVALDVTDCFQGDTLGVRDTPGDTLGVRYTTIHTRQRFRYEAPALTKFYPIPTGALDRADGADGKHAGLGFFRLAR
jgi:hypothetical protein